MPSRLHARRRYSLSHLAHFPSAFTVSAACRGKYPRLWLSSKFPLWPWNVSQAFYNLLRLLSQFLRNGPGFIHHSSEPISGIKADANIGQQNRGLSFSLDSLTVVYISRPRSDTRAWDNTRNENGYSEEELRIFRLAHALEEVVGIGVLEGRVRWFQFRTEDKTRKWEIRGV